MNKFGKKLTINGLPCSMARRVGYDGSYEAVFDRSLVTLDQVEAIRWSRPRVEGECVLPPGCGFEVTDITYSHASKTYTVRLCLAEKYLGDVTGYQAQVADLKGALVEKEAEVKSQAAEIYGLQSQLAEADETAIALYETLLSAAVEDPGLETETNEAKAEAAVEKEVSE